MFRNLFVLLVLGRTKTQPEMKHLLLFILLFSASISVFAQQTTIPDTVIVKPVSKFKLGGDGVYLRDSAWKVGGFLGLTFSQTALYQWGPGGSNNLSFLGSANIYANYKKGKALWQNSLDIKYGEVANGPIKTSDLAMRNFQKNIDLIEYKTNLGYEVTKVLYVSILADFASQFTPSYDYSLTDTSNGRFRKYTTSKFAAPLTINIGPGLTWKPKPFFTLYFSPIEGKMIYVTGTQKDTNTVTSADQPLTPAEQPNIYYTGINPTRFGLNEGTHFGASLGAELDIVFQKDIVKNVNWKSHLNIYAAYVNNNYNTVMPSYNANDSTEGTRNIKASTKSIPQVKWDNDFVFKINKILSATLSTRFVYQYNAQVAIEKNGITELDKNGVPILGFNKLQIFEQFGIALAMKF